MQEAPYERKWLREQDRIGIREKAQRLLGKRNGVKPPMELIEPCYDINKKEYIIRNDIEAEQYKI